MLNQSQTFEFRVKAAVSQQNDHISLVALRPRDELPYICQYEGILNVSYTMIIHLFRLGVRPSHPGQLSLVIPPWVGEMSTNDGCGYR